MLRKLTKIGNLGQVVTGKTPPTKNFEYYGGDTPFLTPSDNMNGKYVQGTSRTLTSEGVKSVSKCLLPPGAICVSCIGTVGKVVVTRDSTVTNQQINSIIPDEALVDPEYLYYCMLPLGRQLNSLSKTSTVVPFVNKTTFSNCEINLFDMQTQSAIGHILAILDEKIEINNRINDYLEELALAIYTQELEWQKADLPNGWDFRPLSDFFPVVTGKKDANIASENGTYPFFTCKQSALMADVYSFDGSAILVAGNGDFNVKWYEGKFEAYQRTYVLMPNNPALLGYLYCAVKRNLSKITSGSRGSVIKFITKGNIADYEIAVPPNLEQSDIVNQLRFILELIDAHKQEIVKLEAMRDTLLPKLMSGKIDVSHVDINQLNMQFIV